MLDQFRANEAVGAWTIVDDHGLAKNGAHLVAEQARHDIIGGAGRERHDEADRMVGECATLGAGAGAAEHDGKRRDKHGSKRLQMSHGRPP